MLHRLPRVVKVTVLLTLGVPAKRFFIHINTLALLFIFWCQIERHARADEGFAGSWPPLAGRVVRRSGVGW